MNGTVIIFTRLPVPGQAKTRLIPRLGPEGAAALHRALAEHTVRTARATDATLEIHHTGDGSAMRRWLGDDLTYRPQPDGDLGARMLAAFQGSGPSTVIIGTDCPALTAPLLTEALSALKKHDVVLGPALDGGYYLIGQNQPQPALFTEMPWGTDTVLATTRTRLRKQALAWHELPSLADVDRPADLDHVPPHIFPPQPRS